MSQSAPSALSSGAPFDPPVAEPDEPAEARAFSAIGLEALYRRHATRLIGRFARSIGRDDARDVVHEAFARLAGTSSPAHPIDCPEAFVTTVATNVLRDRARAAARRALQESQFARESHDVAPDPHSLFESRDALRIIERALAQMSPRRRRIFMLHRFEHLTYAEIGDEVGMSEKGIKKQIAKALVELRCAVERSE